MPKNQRKYSEKQNLTFECCAHYANTGALPDRRSIRKVYVKRQWHVASFRDKIKFSRQIFDYAHFICEKVETHQYAIPIVGICAFFQPAFLDFRFVLALFKNCSVKYRFPVIIWNPNMKILLNYQFLIIYSSFLHRSLEICFD